MDLTKLLADLLPALEANPVLAQRVALAQDQVKILEERNKDLERMLLESEEQVSLLKRQIVEHVWHPFGVLLLLFWNRWCRCAQPPANVWDPSRVKMRNGRPHRPTRLPQESGNIFRYYFVLTL